MRIVVDNALSPRIALALREAGHDAIHVRDLGMSALPDADIFAWAAENDRHVLTKDADFASLAVALGATIPSVIRLRILPSTVEEDAAFTLMALQRFEDDIVQECIVSVLRDRMRVRRLPILET